MSFPFNWVYPDVTSNNWTVDRITNLTSTIGISSEFLKTETFSMVYCKYERKNNDNDHTKDHDDNDDEYDNESRLVVICID